MKNTSSTLAFFSTHMWCSSFASKDDHFLHMSSLVLDVDFFAAVWARDVRPGRGACPVLPALSFLQQFLDELRLVCYACIDWGAPGRMVLCGFFPGGKGDVAALQGGLKGGLIAFLLSTTRSLPFPELSIEETLWKASNTYTNTHYFVLSSGTLCSHFHCTSQGVFISTIQLIQLNFKSHNFYFA